MASSWFSGQWLTDQLSWINAFFSFCFRTIGRWMTGFEQYHDGRLAFFVKNHDDAGCPNRFFVTPVRAADADRCSEPRRNPPFSIHPVFDFVSDMVFSLSYSASPETSIILEYNRAVVSVFDRDNAEVCGRPFSSLLCSKDDKARCETVMRRLLEKGSEPEACVVVFKRHNGTLIRGSVTMIPVNDSGGEPVIIVIVHGTADYHVTDERQCGTDWLIDDSFNELYAIDADTYRIIDANSTASKNLGYAREELQTMKIADIMPDIDSPILSPMLEPLRRGDEGLFVLTTIQRRKDGTTYPVEVHYRYIHHEGGSFFSAIVQDITYRRTAEEERDRLFKYSLDLLCVSDFEGNFHQINPAWVTSLGWSEEELFASSHYLFIHPDDRMRVDEAITKLEAGHSIRNLEVRHVCKDGGYRWISCSMYPLPKERLLFNVGRDITEKKQMEEEQRTLVMLIENSTELIGLYSGNGEILYLNKAGCLLLGVDGIPLQSVKPHDFLPEKEREEFHSIIVPMAISTGSWEGELRIRNVRTRKFLHVDIHMFVVGEDDSGEKKTLAVVMKNITEKKQLESKLAQAQKMEAIGTLAGGIAHDFNNILSIIMGCADLMSDEIAIDQKQVLEYADQIKKAGIRARELVKQILTFSRVSESEKKALMLSLIVKETMKMMRSSLPSTIEIRRNITAERSIVFADQTQINQVLINLCTNAAFAMRDGGGILSVGLDDIEIGEHTAGLERLAPGSYVVLTVSDTGAGIDPSVIDRIFEPYFTTKKVGEGTGMGLAVVHGIVESHGGMITVKSRIGDGTVFNVYLPRMTESSSVNDENVQKPLVRGKGTILFVDDEEIVVEMNKRMLKRIGYDVITATSSLEALKLFREYHGLIHIVISDQTMPTMTGIDLAKEILRIRPEMPIILCTGYSDVLTAELLDQVGIRKLLMKPLSMSDMAETVKSNILNENSGIGRT